MNIERVASSHFPERAEDSIDCFCGHEFTTVGEWAAHVARLLHAALDPQ